MIHLKNMDSVLKSSYKNTHTYNSVLKKLKECRVLFVFILTCFFKLRRWVLLCCPAGLKLIGSSDPPIQPPK